MHKTVLVIDDNPAVQAIAKAALKQLGAEVHPLPPGQSPWEAITSLKPQLVLCAEDLSGIKAYELCRRLKGDSILSSICFVALISSNAEEDADIQAELAGADGIIHKPFKSAALRSLAQKLLAQTIIPEGPTHGAPSVALMIKDELNRKIIERVLNKKQIAFSRFETIKRLKLNASKSSFLATIVDWRDICNSKWSHHQSMGALIIINTEVDTSKNHRLPDDVKTVSTPFSLAKFKQALQSAVPLIIQEEEDKTEPLEKGEQAVLAAKISAAVYELLLNQETLRHRRWEESCTQAAAEALRICRGFKE